MKIDSITRHDVIQKALEDLKKAAENARKMSDLMNEAHHLLTATGAIPEDFEKVKKSVIHAKHDVLVLISDLKRNHAID